MQPASREVRTFNPYNSARTALAVDPALSGLKAQVRQALCSSG